MAEAALQAFKSSNFAPAFFFLPAGRRRALQAIYAFCRAVDDAVDRGGDPAEARAALGAWRALLNAPFTAEPRGPVDPQVWAALRQAMEDFSIDPKHLLGLVDGVERDLTLSRCDTFDDLKAYCYGVASTVGLACLAVFRLDEPSHRDFAVNLGLAVQITNILRDVKTDAARGRVYLPQEDLRRFHYGEAELLDSVYNPAFIRLMRFEAERARGFYAAALAALPPISRPAARTALVIGKIYRELLEKMEREDFNVFRGRVSLSLWEKARCAVGVLLGGGF